MSYSFNSGDAPLLSSAFRLLKHEGTSPPGRIAASVIHPTRLAFKAPSSYGVNMAHVIQTVMVSYVKHSKWLTTLFALGLGGLIQVTMSQVVQNNTKEKKNHEYNSRSAVSATGNIAGGGRTPSLGGPAGGPTSSSSSAAAATVSGSAGTASKRKPVPAVDALFVKRLKYISKIVVPSWNSKEAYFLLIQFWFLVVRTLISLRIAKIGGDALECIALRSWSKFYEVLADFFVSGIAAAVTNSGLKYLSNMVATCFRRNLTKHVHDLYTNDRNYYKAAVLHAMEGHLDNADQRIVADLDDFCKTFSDLYSYTFKPLLDVILCTVQMGRTIGTKGPMALYMYFVFIGAMLRTVSPPFSKYISILKSLEGDFRRGHSRLITNAEEVAFLNGSARERSLLNSAVDRVTQFSEKIHLMHLRQGLLDQYGLKYFASMLGFPILALPFLLKHDDLTPAEAVNKYKVNDALIQQACRAVGDLIMVYKKVQTLAGYTARVSELLEAIEPDLNKSVSGRSKSKANGSASVSVTSQELVHGEPTFELSQDLIQFKNVTIQSPDGRLLIKELNLQITLGQNVLVTGPNGAGKTSLFRVLASLWLPSEGKVIRPSFLDPDNMEALNQRSEIFYVPQKPYLVSGCLRDQILYPLQPTTEHDGRILECLQRVGLSKKLVNESTGGLDISYHDWADVLSGGEKQRVGLARLYFHRPHFAILDEATSAINSDEEGPFYEHLKELGITVFSIAHRLELRRFHSIELNIAGDGKGTYSLTELPSNTATTSSKFAEDEIS